MWDVSCAAAMSVCTLHGELVVHAILTLDNVPMSVHVLLSGELPCLLMR